MGRAMQVRQGEIIAGKYRIERLLGEGGMGSVVLATHLHLDERVAIKFAPQALANEEAVARFAREARAAVKIKSEHVARVSDVGTLDTGAPYMVMEAFQRRDLAELVRSQGRSPPKMPITLKVERSPKRTSGASCTAISSRRICSWCGALTARPASRCLDSLHSLKMPSPGSSGSDLGMTRTHAIMGSPLYMSPEQMASTARRRCARG